MVDPVKPGDRFRQCGGGERVWQVASLFGDAFGHPHAQRARVDDPAAQTAIGVAILRDRRYFRPEQVKTEGS